MNELIVFIRKVYKKNLIMLDEQSSNQFASIDGETNGGNRLKRYNEDFVRSCQKNASPLKNVTDVVKLERPKVSFLKINFSFNAVHL